MKTKQYYEYYLITVQESVEKRLLPTKEAIQSFEKQLVYKNVLGILKFSEIVNKELNIEKPMFDTFLLPEQRVNTDQEQKPLQINVVERLTKHMVKKEYIIFYTTLCICVSHIDQFNIFLKLLEEISKCISVIGIRGIYDTKDVKYLRINDMVRVSKIKLKRSRVILQSEETFQQMKMNDPRKRRRYYLDYYYKGEYLNPTFKKKVERFLDLHKKV